MNTTTKEERIMKRKNANKDRPIVNEDLLKFFPPISRMGGVNPTG